jgi:hypothetical protein
MDENHNDEDYEFDNHGTLSGCAPSFRKLSQYMEDTLVAHLQKYSELPDAIPSVLQEYAEFVILQACTTYLDCLAFYGGAPQLKEEAVKRKLIMAMWMEFNKASSEIIEEHWDEEN